jgi:hypothetical protein
MESDFFCSRCKQPAASADTFCRHCGALFTDGIYCSNHPSVPAEGMCVICSKACCKKCGGDSNVVFLCDSHWTYEIEEGMARVFGCTDNVQAQYVTTCLEQAGYHPFLYSKRFNPGADIVSIQRMTRNYGNHPIVELKVLVPFSEVLGAENTLHELGIIEGEKP